jgi:hypothetical protein
VAIAAQVPAVVVAHGANAAGSRNHLGALAAAGSDPGQVENANGDAVFVADTLRAAFDDQTVWVPSSVLMGRMLQAGTLP